MAVDASTPIALGRGATAVATAPALNVPFAHSQMPIAAVPTSSAAFIAVSQNMNRVIIIMWARIAPWCSSIDSRT